MSDLLRQEVAAEADTIVVKVGTRVVTQADGTLDESQIARLAEDLHQIIETGRKVVLVSSGAVGAGMSLLGIGDRPNDLAHLQAVAAVGQAQLIQSYDRTLRKSGRHAAQVLLTAGDLDDRASYLNVRNTLLTLLEYGALPIINENDTVAVDELMTTFGDNDRLAALVTNLLRAPLLIILSDVEGLYDGDPRDSESKIIPTVMQLDASLFAHVRDASGGLSKGGMASKLEAARIATAAGENVIIASGRQPGLLAEILEGKPHGSLFVAQGKSATPWKRWIGFSVQPRGSLSLDAGAQSALCKKGSSLLPIGITTVEGAFLKGDVISLCDGTGKEIARGLSNYDAREVQQIKGIRSDRIGEILGHCPYEEVIHRDNLMLTNN